MRTQQPSRRILHFCRIVWIFRKVSCSYSTEQNSVVHCLPLRFATFNVIALVLLCCMSCIALLHVVYCFAACRVLLSASHHTGVPGTIRQQGHPPSALATAQSTESMHSPHTTLNGDACGDITEQCWVTVFGFPADAAAYMLQEFAHYGTIIRHSMDVNTNWMHICYQSPLQARKALSKHGKVFMTSVMVGVVPCTDQKVMQLEQHARHEQSSADFTSPVMMRERQGFASQGQQQAARHGTPGGMRPLTSSFQTPNAAAGSAMRDPDTATPRKSDGVIGKAMEYMFGW
eukprot:scpid72372/ scgid1205/ Nucleoporin NUP53; 35 kDa nucleoporin; Nuclear pore complex protein Nup53; Nucleoporin Nup35